MIRPTNPNWFYGSAASAPKRMTGWIPDALIPAEAAIGKGGMPIHLPPSGLQGFWVDLALPRDSAGYAPGFIAAGCGSAQEGIEVAALPVRLELFPAVLPDSFHSTVWLYTGDVEPYFTELNGAEIDRMLKFECHRHRIDCVGGFRAHASPFDSTLMASYRPWLDGSAFREENGYFGPGQGQGERLFPIGMYGGAVMGNTAGEVRAQSDRWVEWFEAQAPGVRCFWYLIDEPGEGEFDWIKERAGWIHSNPGPGKRLPVFTTKAWTYELDQAIDLWAGYQGPNLARLSILRAQGKDHWFYNGARPRYGATILEGEAVDLRMNGWAQYLHEVNTWFIWHGTHWKHNHQGPDPGLHQQVFTNPVTFNNGGDSFGNGDGVLLYPGREPFHPEEDRGLNRLLPSIRLKNIRRGRQDYELMWLAEQKVGRARVEALARQAVPRAFSEVGMNGTVPWSQRGDDYDRVRLELLELLR